MAAPSASSRLHPGAPRGARRRRVLTGRNVALGLVVAGLLFALHFTEFEWSDVPDLLQRVNRPLALLIMATLPIVGFSISAVYLAIGAVFGPAWGGLVVVGITLIHVTTTHFLAKTILRRRVAQWHAAWMRRMPVVSQGDHVSLVAMIVIVPALPYFIRNCLLAVSEVPLRYVYGVAVPLYLARSYTTLYLGNLGNHASARTVWILGGIFAVKLAISALLYRRLRQRARAAPGG